MAEVAAKLGTGKKLKARTERADYLRWRQQASRRTILSAGGVYEKPQSMKSSATG